ncbi:hypothetical protein M2157_009518 [Streptomyces sp. SAI-127]|nr:hypothetical protein [Streptomyces sp. SAI-127]
MIYRSTVRGPTRHGLPIVAYPTAALPADRALSRHGPISAGVMARGHVRGAYVEILALRIVPAGPWRVQYRGGAAAGWGDVGARAQVWYAVRVPWDRLADESPKVSEALVTMLVLRLRQRARAVDGSGGDGGRDLFEYTAGGELLVYEAKSFTGRMDQTRRKQVVPSLVSKARLALSPRTDSACR